jgi:hypothetical protein
VPFDEYCTVVPHPKDCREFKERISDFLTAPLDIQIKLWECALSNGSLGSSGAIIEDKTELITEEDSETVLLFRIHHVLCDGVSLSTVVSDASEESANLNDMIFNAIRKKNRLLKHAGIASRLSSFIRYYFCGSIYALSKQFWNMTVSTNPFEIFSVSSTVGKKKRSVAWKYLATVQEAKATLKAISSLTKHATLNDLFVSLLSSALEKQYSELSDYYSISYKIQPSVNIVCPVHLDGGVLPDNGIGNSIGAFVTTAPFNPANPFSPISRLRKVSQNLHNVKQTPAAKISWLISAFISTFTPESFAKYAIVQANCNAAATISNVHGFPKKIHWMSRPVEILCAFLPLPPGIPIGIVVTSYDGNIIMSIDADEGVVPNADKFLDYMIGEYAELKKESELSTYIR